MTRGSSVIVIAALVVVVSSWSRASVAQDGAQLPSSYLVVKGGLGFGGTVSVHNDRYQLNEDRDDDEMEPEPEPEAEVTIPAKDGHATLNTSFGGQVEYMFGLHRFFALGGLFGVRSWRSVAGIGANEGMSLGLDTGIIPQGRIQFGPRFELYVSLPITLTLSILNEYRAWTERAHSPLGTAIQVSPTYGYGLGVVGGARFAISGSFGLLAEVGYQRYAFTHEVQFKVAETTMDTMGLGTGLSVDFVTEQIRLSVGAFF